MDLRLLSFVLALFCLSETKLPPYIHVCKRSDPELAKCVIESVNALKPQLIKGIPELNVPSLEPLPLSEIKLKSGPSSAKIDANITNILVYGPSAFEIVDLSVNPDKNIFIFKAKLPHIYFKGHYDIDMNVLVLKYKGEGPITGNFTGVSAEVSMKGEVRKINGQNHLHFSKFRFHLEMDHSYLHLGNLFADQRNLGVATNHVVNDNADIFIKEIQPVLESSLADKFTEVANIITKTFNYEELFPN